MTVEEAKTALEDLLASPGWGLFRAYVESEWWPEAYGRKVQQVIAQHSGTLQLAPEVEKLHHTTTQVVELVKWPGRHLKKLQTDRDAPVPMQRGGR